MPKYKRFKVTGIFSSSFYEYDSSWAFIPLADAQKLFDLGDVVSVLEFKIDDIYQAPEIAQKLEAAAGKGFMLSLIHILCLPFPWSTTNIPSR